MTIAELLKQVGITEFNKPIKWGDVCPCDKQGIYIISFSKNPYDSKTYPEPQFDDDAIRKWIDFLVDFKLNNRRPTVDNIKHELKRFWLKDESILYIGHTTRSLRIRINENYKTKKLGKSSPHSGGQWLKTLKKRNELYIHYIPTNLVKNKATLLKYFLKTSGELPFANITIQAPKPQNIKFYKKQHNFKKQRKKHIN